MHLGYGFDKYGEDISDIFSNLDFDKKDLKGFVPEFDKLVRLLDVEHTLLGDVKIDIYSAMLQGKQIEWAMGHDEDGRVWIDSIKFA
jgi:hypothetical protein